MRRWMQIVLLASMPIVTFAAPTVTPSTATVYVRGQVQFSSTDTVTWSMASGSTGSISAGGLYTAPASFQAKNVMDGCPLLPNDHIYNTRIDNLPVDANSDTRIRNILGGATTYIQFEISFPHNILSSETPTTTMDFLYTSGSNGLQFPILPFPYLGAEASAIPESYFARDRHILGISTTTCQMYEMYNYYPVGSATSQGCPTCNSSSGVTYHGASYALPPNGAGVDAAGLHVQPLSLHYSELKAGAINHALRFTMANGYNYSGFLWPATSYTNQCGNFTTCIPYGSRFRLKSSVDISGFSPTAQVILTALKKYGMIMADGGTTLHLQAENDVFIDTTTRAAIYPEIHFNTSIGQFQFEQVDESSLMISSATGRVKVPNAYVTPSNYAEVIATKNSDSSTATVRVALQSVTVGTYNPSFPTNAGTLSVMAGTPQFQIPYVVHGATTPTVTCSMSPTIGALTSDCLYTAPSSQVNFASTTIVTITSTVDSTGTVSFPLTVFPSDGIRIDVGGKTIFNISPVIPYTGDNYGPDASGSLWFSDPTGMGLQWLSRDDIGYPQSSWPAYTDVGLWYTIKNGGSDGFFSAMVPNGNYTLRMGFAYSTDPSLYFGQSIDSQGQTIVSTTTYRSLIGTGAFNPVETSQSIQVTDNRFYFTMRATNENYFTLINNWSLTPAAAAPGGSSTTSGTFKGTSKLSGGVTVR